MTARIHFKSAGARTPQSIRDRLRFLFEDDALFPQAMKLSGAADHPRREEFEAAWNGWIKEALRDRAA